MAKMTDAERQANFVRLATARTNACLDKVRLLGNLASGQYAKTPEQVESIFTAIESELAAQRSKFTATKADRPQFTL